MKCQQKIKLQNKLANFNIALYLLLAIYTYITYQFYLLAQQLK